jgi:hypothetical protein
MRSNIQKHAKDENNNGPVKGAREVPSNIYCIQAVKTYVQEDFEKLDKDLGEEACLDILHYMLSTKYLRKYQPQTVEVKAAVKICVSSLVKRVSAKKLGQSLKSDEIPTKTDVELQAQLDRLKELKKSMGAGSRTGIDKLIAQYKEEIDGRERARIEKENAEREKAIQKAKAIEERKLAEQKERATEVAYYEKVKAYTKNFSFLSDSAEHYYSIYGGQNIVKFANVEQYVRYAHLRELLNAKRNNDKLSENDAIELLLADSKLNLKVADRKILLERQSVIVNQKDNVIRKKDTKER